MDAILENDLETPFYTIFNGYFDKPIEAYKEDIIYIYRANDVVELEGGLTNVSEMKAYIFKLLSYTYVMWQRYELTCSVSQNSCSESLLGSQLLPVPAVH